MTASAAGASGKARHLAAVPAETADADTDREPSASPTPRRCGFCSWRQMQPGVVRCEQCGWPLAEAEPA